MFWRENDRHEQVIPKRYQIFLFRYLGVELVVIAFFESS